MRSKPLLSQVDPQRRAHVDERLASLRAALDAEVPRKVLDDGSIRIATFNIRELGGNGKGGARLPESLLYIAELLSRFDVIAIQEVRDLDDLDRLRDVLGNWWKFIYTDVTEGVAGNCERLTFLYDSRVVVPTGLAGEIVLPAGKGAQVIQYARTPYVCGFKAGWCSFELCTVHIYYGDDKPDDPRRLEEIRSLAKLLQKRAKKSDAHMLVLGDFNIFAHADECYGALTKAGFEVPTELQSIPGSNVPRDKRYDQIAIHPHAGKLTVRRAGVFDFYRHVLRMKPGAEADDAALYPEAKKFKEWRTFEMSDHLPMWVELEIDGTERIGRVRPWP